MTLGAPFLASFVRSGDFPDRTQHPFPRKKPSPDQRGPFQILNSYRLRPTRPSPRTHPAALRIPFCTRPSRKNISCPQTSSEIQIASRPLPFRKQDPLSFRLLGLSSHSGMQRPFLSSSGAKSLSAFVLFDAQTKAAKTPGKFFQRPCTLYAPNPRKSYSNHPQLT